MSWIMKLFVNIEVRKLYYILEFPFDFNSITGLLEGSLCKVGTKINIQYYS